MYTGSTALSFCILGLLPPSLPPSLPPFLPPSLPPTLPPTLPPSHPPHFRPISPSSFCFCHPYFEAVENEPFRDAPFSRIIVETAAESVGVFNAVVKDLPFRNGYFYELSTNMMQRKLPDPCPLHTKMLRKVLCKKKNDCVTLSTIHRIPLLGVFCSHWLPP